MWRNTGTCKQAITTPASNSCEWNHSSHRHTFTMPWDTIQLNDGVCYPTIGFHPHSWHVSRECNPGHRIRDVDPWQRSGSYRPGRPGDFRWIQPYRRALWRWSSFAADPVRPDTAQSYLNEEEAGIALRESGLARKDIFITTKYSGLNGLDIESSIQNSLKNVRAASLASPWCCGSHTTTLLIAWS